MPKILRDIYRDDLPPKNHNMLWENTIDDRLYSFRSGEWKPIGSSDSPGEILKDSIYKDTDVKHLISK